MIIPHQQCKTLMQQVDLALVILIVVVIAIALT
jgi:hypothetical protein